MNRPAPAPESTRHWISDLADGRLRDDALDGACRDWAADGEARRTWHAYHVIGDVLRSEDLATDARGDAAFLAAIRTRLADEPVVLAPARPRRRQVWLAPVAAAAGFVAVAGVVVVLRQAEAPAPSAGVQLASGTLSVPARLDAAAAARHQAQVEAYLRAHREALAGSPAALPGGGLRTVEFTVPQR